MGKQEGEMKYKCELTVNQTNWRGGRSYIH